MYVHVYSCSNPLLELLRTRTHVFDDKLLGISVPDVV